MNFDQKRNGRAKLMLGIVAMMMYESGRSAKDLVSDFDGDNPEGAEADMLAAITGLTTDEMRVLVVDLAQEVESYFAQHNIAPVASIVAKSTFEP